MKPICARIGRIGDVVDAHAGGVVLAALAEAAAVHLAGAAVVLLLRQQRALIGLLDAQQQVLGRLQMHATRTSDAVGTKFTGFGLRGSRTSVTMMPRLTRVPTYAWPRCDHHLDAVAAAALVGMADEFDVPGAFRDDHGLLPSLIGRQLRPGSRD